MMRVSLLIFFIIHVKRICTFFDHCIFLLYTPIINQHHTTEKEYAQNLALKLFLYNLQ